MLTPKLASTQVFNRVVLTGPAEDSNYQDELDNALEQGYVITSSIPDAGSGTFEIVAEQHAATSDDEPDSVPSAEGGHEVA